MQHLVYVNEKNLYKVIMRSDKPQAEPFQDWVCGEVLPSIRKTGSYTTSKPSTFIPVNTFEISNLTGRPHARIMRDIQKILEQGAGADDFIFRYRPVETECGTRDYESYDITPKGMLILATGYPPLLRDRIAARLMEILRGGNEETGMYPVPTPEGMTAEAVRECERRNAELWRIIEEKNRVIDGLTAGKQSVREIPLFLEEKPQLHETAGGRVNRSIARPHYPGTYLVNDMRCALMKERGICLRSRDIFRWLRREGWICSDGNAYNKPSEMAVRNGWMLPAVGNGKRNTDKSHFTPRLTESGYRAFVEAVMRKGGVL